MTQLVNYLAARPLLIQALVWVIIFGVGGFDGPTP